jgi:hypothetical protein
MYAGRLAKQAPVSSAVADGYARISMRANNRRRFEEGSQMAGFAARKPGPGNMRNAPESSSSNGGLADLRGAAGRSLMSGLLNPCIFGGLPFEGGHATGKSNGRRER